MKNLVTAVVVLAIVIGAFAFYRGWFHASTSKGAHESNVTITVDKDKVHADEDLAKETINDLEQKLK